MHFEHFALNVSDPVAMGRWYCEHLGLTARVAKTDTPTCVHFLADASGRVVMEMYHNAACPVPDYANEDPLRFHFAFVSQDVEADKARLLTAGATSCKDEVLPDGSRVVTLRDPWGVPVQLVRRTTPFD
ncbi:MAG: VOC family protein [Phycisphaeraceae bacterium]